MTDAEAQAYAALAEKTGMSREEWADFFKLPESAQLLVAKTYAQAPWVQSRDTWADVVAAIGVIAAIAGAISGVAGAYKAISAL